MSKKRFEIIRERMLFDNETEKTIALFVLEDDAERMMDLLNSFVYVNKHLRKVSSSFVEENEKILEKNKQLEKENEKLKKKWFNNIDWDSVLDRIIIWSVLLFSIIGASTVLFVLTNLILGVV